MQVLPRSRVSVSLSLSRNIVLLVVPRFSPVNASPGPLLLHALSSDDSDIADELHCPVPGVESRFFYFRLSHAFVSTISFVALSRAYPGKPRNLTEWQPLSTSKAFKSWLVASDYGSRIRPL